MLQGLLPWMTVVGLLHGNETRSMKVYQVKEVLALGAQGIRFDRKHCV